MHSLQSLKDLSWDARLNQIQLREWINIAKQYNSSDTVSIPRFVGDRSEKYRIIAFTDASTLIYGCVVYIQNLRTNQVSYLLAKNRIVGKLMENKTAPNIELSAILLGVEVLQDIRR